MNFFGEHPDTGEIIQLKASYLEDKFPREKKAKQIYRWLVNNLPEDSEVILASFNKDLKIKPNTNDWIDSRNKIEIEGHLVHLLTEAPDHGTNLQLAFKKLEQWKDADSIYLITDGLPTQAIKPSSSTPSLKDGRIERCLKKELIDLECRLNFFSALE